MNANDADFNKKLNHKIFFLFLHAYTNFKKLVFTVNQR